MFIYFWEGRKGQRERETEFQAGSRLSVVSTEPNPGLELTNQEIMTWAEVESLTNWATQAPTDFFKRKYILFFRTVLDL